jgi:tetratricopeptide (TPR) repeat protein
MNFSRKSLVLASFLALTILAGFLSNILTPVLADAGSPAAAHPVGSGQFNSFTLLGQLRMSLDDYFWLRTDDYLHFGITNNVHTKLRVQQEMIADSIKAVGSEPRRNLVDSAVPHQRDWRGIFQYFDFMKQERGQHGDPAELLPWYRAQTIINPLDVPAYVNGAFFLADFAKKPEEARDFLEEGIRRNPENPELLEAAGRLYFEKWKDYDSAIPYLEKAIATGKKIEKRTAEQEKALGDAYVFLVRALREKNEREAALKAAEEGIAECPNNMLVRSAYRIAAGFPKNRTKLLPIPLHFKSRIRN